MFLFTSSSIADVTRPTRSIFNMALLHFGFTRFHEKSKLLKFLATGH